MQTSLRPYATAGIAIVGASIIAVTPVAAPPIPVQVRPVQLVDAWSDLISNTVTNLDNIVSNANLSDITQVFSALLTNPFGVIGAFTNLDPTVTADIGSLPATITVDMPPGLELGISGLGAWGALATAINNVLPSVESNPANLYEAIATVLNGYLNGEDNISLLDGAITIPAWNGILAPETSLDVNLNLTSLIDALGLGNTPLTDLDLSSLLSQIGLGDLNLGTLFSDLGLSTKGLGDLLGDPTLGTLLNDLGLGNLDVGSLSLTNLLNDLGLNSGLFNLSLGNILQDLGLNSDTFNLTLGQVLSGLGFTTPLPSFSLQDLLTDLGLDENIGGVNLGTLFSDIGLGSTTLGSLLDLNSIIGAIPGIGVLLTPVVNALSDIPLSTILSNLFLGGQSTGILDLSTLLSNLGLTATTGSNLTIADLLNDLLGGKLPSVDSLTVGDILGDLLGTNNLPVTGNLTIGQILTDLLGAANLPSTGDLNLSTLLGDLGGLTNSILDTNVGSLLNTLDLGTLLNDLGLSSLPLNLSDLGDLSNLNLGDLLGDLGLGDLANISVEPLGGYVTLLADVVPQQILAALGM